MSEVHAETIGFTRETMLPAKAPPVTQTGVILWLRENLFSSVFNGILTVVGLAIAAWLVSAAWPWLTHSVWNANSLAECRNIIADAYGEGAGGACWALIRERWGQFIFGFYPSELYWRPILTLALLFVALTPLLFSENPMNRRVVVAASAVIGLALLWVFSAPMIALVGFAAVIALAAYLSEMRVSRMFLLSALFPAFAFWLLWGGSLWIPLLVTTAPLLGYAVLRLTAPLGALLSTVLAIAAVVGLLVFGLGPIDTALRAILPLDLVSIASDRFGGFLLSLVLGVSAIGISLPLGIILALARRSELPLVRTFAVVFIEFIRGVPLIALLFVASLLLNYFLPPKVEFDIIFRVIIMVTLFASAYIAEVIRGGLAALPRGQYEAADSLGLTYWKAQRLIILPQALKISIPGIVSTFIGMFKDTTLVVFVGLFDPLKAMSDTVRASFAWKGIYWEPYIFVGAIFFIFCFAMSRYSMFLERRLMRGHH